MFVYLSLELVGGGGEYKNNVLMWLICLFLIFCKSYVTGFVQDKGGEGEKTCKHAKSLCIGLNLNGYNHGETGLTTGNTIPVH